MCGSLCGVKISMFIEKLLGAEADGHLKSKVTTEDLAAYWSYRESDVYRPGIAPLKFQKWFKNGKPKEQEWIRDSEIKRKGARDE